MSHIKLQNLGTGSPPQPRDERDFRAEPIFGVIVIDWSKEFRVIEPSDENQGSSQSCVSQSWSYYHWQLVGKDYSRRSLYSRIFLPTGGAYLRDGGKEITTRGHATRDEAPDPGPIQTEDAMRNRSDITAEEETSDIEQEYRAFQEEVIDYYAYAIKEYKGVVLGVRGTWKAWEDLTNPQVPTDNDFWYHALYGMGYHLHDNQKCIIAKSSWCGLYDKTTKNITWPIPSNWDSQKYEHHHEHHIKEDYFKSGGIYNNWVLIPKEKQVMIEFVNIEGTGEYGLLVKSAIGTQYIPASTPEDLKKRFPQVPVKSNGDIDYDKARKIKL